METERVVSASEDTSIGSRLVGGKQKDFKSQVDIAEIFAS